MDEKPCCWKCQGEIAPPIRFRTLCPHCGVDLHCCTACRFYSPGKPNDCAVPDTEWVRDKEALNFCEEFRIKSPPSPHDIDPKERARKLLGF